MLKDRYPASFTDELVNDSREAVHNIDRNRDGDFYAKPVGDVFREVGRKLKPAARLAFSFHHAGEHGWRYIEDALVRGGFVVERWWPVFAEMESGVHMLGKDNGGHLDIVFVCGKAGEVTTLIKTEPAADLGARLAKDLTLVPADFRALLKATEVQRATWSRAKPASAPASSHWRRVARRSAIPQNVDSRAAKLHKQLHTRRTFDREQVDLNEKA